MMSKIKQYLYDGMISRSFTIDYLMKKEEILHTQKIFEEYKGSLVGKKVVIVATGPSLNKYKPMQDAIHIGVNKAYKREDIKFDYYFVQDYPAVSNYILGLENVNCTKFAGQYILEKYRNAEIPDSIIKRINAQKYYLSYPLISFAQNLSEAPFAGASTVVITALQFAVFAQASEIYLVGCDTSNNGYFDRTKNKIVPNLLISDYIKFKNYTEKHHEDTKIISINPVGLKGIFNDIYAE